MKTIKISEETFEKLKDQLSECIEKDINDWEDLIGQSIFFRTVTYHFTGRVKKVKWPFFELEDAAWQAYQPRLKNFLEGDLNEVEPIGRLWINIESCTDFMPYKPDLPMEQQ